MKKLIIIGLVLFSNVGFAQNKTLPSKAPINFGPVIEKLLTESPEDFPKSCGEIKNFTENEDLKQYHSVFKLPLADSCYFIDDITEEFDTYKVFEATFGFYKSKKDGLKALETLSRYMSDNPGIMKVLSKEPLDDSEDGVVQLFVGKNPPNNATVLSIYLETVEAINPNTQNPMEYYKLTLSISEDFSL